MPQRPRIPSQIHSTNVTLQKHLTVINRGWGERERQRVHRKRYKGAGTAMSQDCV